MDFFAQQDSARRRTGLLIVLFFAAIALTVLAVYAVFVFLLPSLSSDSTSATRDWWDPSLFATVGFAILGIVGIGSLYKIAELAGGGDRVARMLGARLVSPQTADADERKYLNIVEEMALASGISPPPAYVIDGELGINAFAAGYRPDAAVVCVTEGALRRLTRDELQGVVAHEFSHILNGDMRLNIRLIGVLHGLLLIALIGQALLRTASFSGGRRRRSKDGDKAGAILLLIGLALLMIGSVGVFFGRLIQAAVSRQREFLADAAAVQFTRNPLGLAGALKKIAGVAGSRVERNGAEAASHLFFANALRGGLFNLFATHPPIIERIRRLDATFPPATLASTARDPAEPLAASAAELTGSLTAASVASPAVPTPPLLRSSSLSPRTTQSWMDSIGAPWQAHLAAVRIVLDSLPSEVREAARDSAGARTLICALLLDRDHRDLRERQLNLLRELAGASFEEDTRRLGAKLDNVPDGFRLAVLDLALPTIKTLPLAEYQALVKNVDALIRADDSITLFEYAARRMVQKTRETAGGPGLVAQPLSAFSAEISCLLSAMAHAGQKDPIEAERAFARVVSDSPHSVRLKFLAPEHCGVDRIDTALRRLERLAPAGQRWLLWAALECLAHNGTVEPKEADLFRIIAATMDCPVPLSLA